MSPRLAPPAPPTDPRYWRRLLALAHPDRGGADDLFVWVQGVHQHVAGDAPEDARSASAKRQPPPHRTAGERLDFTSAYSVADGFEELTARAVAMADEVPEPFARLLRLLRSCYPTTEVGSPLYRAQRQGGTYKQAAYVAHLSGMDASQRREWYRIAESVPLSQAHLGHLIKELQQGRAA